jgi:hypothetical protein
MHRQWLRILGVVLLLGLQPGALTLAQTPVPASPASYSLDWITVDSGGGHSAGGTYSLTGTIGQPDAGRLSSDSLALLGAFLGGSVPSHWLYLPLLQK